MNEIEKKVKEIKEWADADGRSAFILLREGSEQLNVASTTQKDLISMFSSLMRDNKIIADALKVTLFLHMNRI